MEVMEAQECNQEWLHMEDMEAQECKEEWLPMEECSQECNIKEECSHKEDMVNNHIIHQVELC